MSRKRTRERKENIHYPFLVSWQESSKKDSSQASVKGESKNARLSESQIVANPKRADNQANWAEFEFIKKDIVKSLITTSLVLILEVVVYLAWKRIFLS